VVTQTTTERLHIVEGTDWKDAVIALLDDRSPYRPWRYGFGEAHEGDPVAIVLHTDPPSVMTARGKNRHRWSVRSGSGQVAISRSRPG
jgi:hypothetical protein